MGVEVFQKKLSQVQLEHYHNQVAALTNCLVGCERIARASISELQATAELSPESKKLLADTAAEKSFQVPRKDTHHKDEENRKERIEKKNQDDNCDQVDGEQEYVCEDDGFQLRTQRSAVVQTKGSYSSRRRNALRFGWAAFVNTLLLCTIIALGQYCMTFSRLFSLKMSQEKGIQYEIFREEGVNLSAACGTGYWLLYAYFGFAIVRDHSKQFHQPVPLQAKVWVVISALAGPILWIGAYRSLYRWFFFNWRSNCNPEVNSIHLTSNAIAFLLNTIGPGFLVYMATKHIQEPEGKMYKYILLSSFAGVTLWMLVGSNPFLLLRKFMGMNQRDKVVLGNFILPLLFKGVRDLFMRAIKGSKCSPHNAMYLTVLRLPLLSTISVISMGLKLNYPTYSGVTISVLLDAGFKLFGRVTLLRRKLLELRVRVFAVNLSNRCKRSLLTHCSAQQDTEAQLEPAAVMVYSPHKYLRLESQIRSARTIVLRMLLDYISCVSFGSLFLCFRSEHLVLFGPYEPSSGKMNTQLLVFTMGAVLVARLVVDMLTLVCVRSLPLYKVWSTELLQTGTCYLRWELGLYFLGFISCSFLYFLFMLEKPYHLLPQPCKFIEVPCMPDPCIPGCFRMAGSALAHAEDASARFSRFFNRTSGEPLPAVGLSPYLSLACESYLAGNLSSFVCKGQLAWASNNQC
eukprot:CAMPEP_0175121232 /NCGR_PEP_ID=MMETSP0087-20121206/1057_1 /TAXON_ID=136419 /ORGANISM="Unknown Unknown, Strain D1" /LENGTH=685 /DNA_ID=CAMNT_0016402757 /DNA_START=67 /DNA_END=2124 /DNA_ORIENTATION=-